MPASTSMPLWMTGEVPAEVGVEALEAVEVIGSLVSTEALWEVEVRDTGLEDVGALGDDRPFRT